MVFGAQIVISYDSIYIYIYKSLLRIPFGFLLIYLYIYIYTCFYILLLFLLSISPSIFGGETSLLKNCFPPNLFTNKKLRRLCERLWTFLVPWLESKNRRMEALELLEKRVSHLVSDGFLRTFFVWGQSLDTWFEIVDCGDTIGYIINQWIFIYHFVRICRDHLNGTHFGKIKVDANVWYISRDLISHSVLFGVDSAI